MRTPFHLLVVVGILSSLLLGHTPMTESSSDHNKTNKFRERDASDDMLPYPNVDDESLLNSKCPKNLELRWQTEVSSSIYASPLIADINSDGKLEIVVPSFVHYLEVLEGSDGDKLPDWPVFHQSTVHASPLLFDIDKDGTREIALATYNWVINFFRISGYVMTDKLEVPRRKVRKNWHVGLHPDPIDRTHPDVYDASLFQEAPAMNSSYTQGSTSASNIYFTSNFDNASSTNASKSDNGDHNSTQAQQNNGLPNNLDNTNNIGIPFGNDMKENSTASHRRLLQEIDDNGNKQGTSGSHANSAEMQGANMQNDGELEEDAKASFDLFRNGDDLADEYGYDYDDYVDESMWGDENWVEENHEKLEDYVNIDSHILCTPVIADIDNYGIQEMVIAVSYFFDREYYTTMITPHIRQN